MTVTANEFEQIAYLDPRAVVRYLRSCGWTPGREFGRGRLWTLSAPGAAEGSFEVLVPLDPQVRDYPSRITDLLRTLAVVEDRRAADVLLEIALPSADKQYLRLQPPTPSGTAPLLDIVPAVTGLRDLLFSAASAAASQEVQPVQPTQKPQRVKDFIARVRLGQTRPGSYIIATHTPLSTASQTQLAVDENPSEPFERQVSRRLYAGVLCALTAAATSLEQDSLDDFDRYTGAGLSANLCEALVRIGGEESRGFEFSFGWSPDLPVGQDTPPVAISDRMLPVLEDGAKDLRARLGQRDVRVWGSVVRLLRDLPHGPGEITVSGHLEGEFDRRPRRFRMTLQAEDYSKANAAHERGNEVSVRGDLVMHGSLAYLERVHSFSMIQVTE